MQKIEHKINLNMSQPNNFEYIHAMQGDYDAEFVIATLYDKNTIYNNKTISLSSKHEFICNFQ